MLYARDLVSKRTLIRICGRSEIPLSRTKSCRGDKIMSSILCLSYALMLTTHAVRASEISLYLSSGRGTGTRRATRSAAPPE